MLVSQTLLSFVIPAPRAALGSCSSRLAVEAIVLTIRMPGETCGIPIDAGD